MGWGEKDRSEHFVEADLIVRLAVEENETYHDRYLECFGDKVTEKIVSGELCLVSCLGNLY